MFPFKSLHLYTDDKKSSQTVRVNCDDFEILPKSGSMPSKVAKGPKVVRIKKQFQSQIQQAAKVQ